MTKHLRDEPTVHAWRLSGAAALHGLRDASQPVQTPQAHPDPKALYRSTADFDPLGEFDLMDNVPV